MPCPVPIGIWATGMPTSKLGAVEARRLLAVATACAGAASIAVTVAIRLGPVARGSQGAATWLMLEPLLLAVLVGVVVRWSPSRAAVLSGSLSALGSALWVQRFLIGVPVLDSVAASATWLIPSLASGTIAWYLRWSEFARTEAIALARAEQRSRLAVDLHDYVAHDISEIVARAQAGSAVLPLGDPRVAELLAQIEAAGLRALESMDQTVRALNEDDILRPRPRGGIDEIEQLVRRFAAAGEVDATVDSQVYVHIGAETGTEAYRTVVEALTNVRRHAVGATHVRVDLFQAGDRLFVSVSDDGSADIRTAESAEDSSTGGLGLVAMRERVELLGGSVEAGPRQPRGWTVVAQLPLPDVLSGEQTR